MVHRTRGRRAGEGPMCGDGETGTSKAPGPPLAYADTKAGAFQEPNARVGKLHLDQAAARPVSSP